MTIATRPLDYSHDGVAMEAMLAADGGDARPTVLVCHTWAGRGEFEVETARRMAEWGYTGVAVDVYGKDVRGNGPDECIKLITPLLQDRALLQARLAAALAAARAQPEVGGPVAVIGFCFGGLCAIDTARMGADVAGVVSFHGNLTPPANLPVGHVAAKVLALHGHDDPLVPAPQPANFAEEMTRAGADWQLHVYGGTKHSFMMPGANAPAMGAVYNPVAARRGWVVLRDFLEEVFG